MRLRENGKLSATRVMALTEPGRYADGNGLYLQISRWKTKSWMLRYQLSGRAREMGLGALGTVGLKEAREKARAARLLLIDGTDPIEARIAKKRMLKAELAKRVTFREAAEQCIASRRDGWRNEKHAAQWTATLSRYVYPIIGGLSVAQIETGHILKILEPIWSTKTETASRVRGRIENILNWATSRHYRQGENPARWKGHLENLLHAKVRIASERHQPAMPYQELPRFIDELRTQVGISARALEFTILTAARTGEAINATWEEFDLKSALWTIPGERMKAGRSHSVPLSRRVIEILEALPRETGSNFVFPGMRRASQLSNMAMLQLLRGMRGNTSTVHGFRSSFRDWAGDETNFQREVVEAALAHTIRDQSEAAYRHGTALEKRRRLMEAWAGYCGRAAHAGSVTPIRKVA